MKKRYGRRTAFLLLGVMLCLQGCGGGSGNIGVKEGQGRFASAQDGKNGETGMGRYLEKEVTLPEEVASISDYPKAYLQRLESGELVLMEQAAGWYVSPDQGETWAEKPASWYEELEAYVSHIALAPDGSAAVIYDPYEEGPEDVHEASGEVYEYVPEYLYVDPEGNTRKLEAPDSEQWLTQFWFGRDSRLYACDLGGGVYEMDSGNGTAGKLFEVEGVSDYVCFVGRYLIVFTSKNDVFLYDLENRILAEEDPVLKDFVQNSAGSFKSGSADGYRLLAAAGEEKEDVLYLVYGGGIYRHVLGGSVMEQLAEGSISSLGDPQTSLHGFAVLPDNEFLVLFDHARLYRYVYDPDIPTVPEEQICIYSLREDNTIRQAVSLFQRSHPELYVRYETGLSGDTGMTAEDAVKNLNTRLMSGNGPDLLVLDGLPLRSYEEKGVLTDLSAIVHELNEEDHLFKNLVDACRTEGRLYYLPVRFRIPLLVGDRESVEQVQDLSSLADAVEALRREYPQGALIGLRTEEEVLQTLQMTCCAAWTDPADGTADREKLTEFLRCARRIYEAETEGISEEELEDYRENYEEHWQSDTSEEGMYYAVASANAIDVAMETQKLGAGVTYQMNCEFNTVSTLAGQRDDFAYRLWQGQVANGFLPRSMVGICAGSEKKETVLAFFRYLYGRELQDLELPSGFPVNEASFETLRENPREGEVFDGAGIVLVSGLESNGGEIFSLDVRWSPREDFERLRDMARSVTAVCTGDSYMKQTVCELGVKAVNGSAAVEETVDEILKKAAVYLSE